MERLEEFSKLFDTINGHQGLVDLQYYWVSQDRDVVCLAIPGMEWGEIPKERHGKVLGWVHKDLGAPLALYVFFEARCAKMGKDDESYRQKLEDHRNKYGTLEGFDGVADHVVMIGYDGANFHTKMVEVSIDKNETRHFQGEVSVIDSSLGGIFCDNLIEGFYNTQIANQSAGFEH